MTQFAADDFAYIAAKQREIAEIAEQNAAARKHVRYWVLACTQVPCGNQWESATETGKCPKCGEVGAPAF